MAGSSARSQSRFFSTLAVAALLGANVGLRDILVYAETIPFVEQSFTFNWNADEPVPIPTTAQCDTIHITWSRDGLNTQINPNSPDPVAPYYLQVYTSLSPIPFIIDAGSDLSFDWAVPFNPGTLYQVCMFDSNGASGGCQATYTVYPALNATLDNPPTCQNTTFPPTLNVTAQMTTGPLGQYSWVPQCTDISVKPTAGVPPYTLTIAPALHPIYNITSKSTDAINWTVTLSYGMPFFISLVDANGTAWATGPLHSGGNGPTSCLDTDDTTVKKSSKDDVAPAVAIGAGIGGLFGGLIVGILGTIFFFCRRPRSRQAHLDSGEKAASISLVPNSSLGERYQDLPSNSSTGIFGGSRHTRNESHVEPFLLSSPEPNLEHARDPSDSLSRQFGTSSSRPLSAVDDSTQAQYDAVPPPAPAPSIMSPVPQTPITPGGERAIYVVHHDGGRAPVTVYTSDGAEVVELPPQYQPSRRERGRDRGMSVSENSPLRQTRQPNAPSKPPRRVAT